MTPDVAQLRQAFSADQRAILSFVWHEYRKRKEWVPVRVVHGRYGTEEVRAALEELGGGIIIAHSHAPKEVYQLTFLGVLLTDQGEEAEMLLARYLGHIRDRFSTDPEIDMVTSGDLEGALGLTEQESALLGEMIQLGNFWHGGGRSDKEWTAMVPSDVDEYPRIGDLRAYVHQSALRDYDPSLPVREQDRRKYDSQKHREKEAQSEFSFIADPELRRQLACDWQEAQNVRIAEAWKSCVVLCGGILEGLLLNALSADEERAKQTYRGLWAKARVPSLDRWDLGHLADCAEKIGILRGRNLHLTHAIRECRDLVHPGRQIRLKEQPTAADADIGLAAVKICLEALRAHAVAT